MDLRYIVLFFSTPNTPHPLPYSKSRFYLYLNCYKTLDIFSEYLLQINRQLFQLEVGWILVERCQDIIQCHYQPLCCKYKETIAKKLLRVCIYAYLNSYDIAIVSDPIVPLWSIVCNWNLTKATYILIHKFSILISHY